MSKIKELLNANSVTLFHDYRLGHANDLSKNANNGVLAGTKKFIHGGIIDPGVSGYVSVPSNPLIFTPNASIFILAKWIPRKDINNGAYRVLILETATTSTFIYLDYSSGIQNIIFYKSVPFMSTTKVASKPFTNTKCMAITWSNNTKPKLYLDGVYDGEFSINWVSEGGVTSSIKILGNGATAPFNPLTESIFCTNTQLSDTDVAQVTSELIRQEY
ncbi:MAG: hypothetical protein PHI67_08160 [Candidatus Methanomethylophilaceae archaeon]|nr:hypothetical protein [Candidatus Methanomethylophilaceae archaeon]